MSHTVFWCAGDVARRQALDLVDGRSIGVDRVECGPPDLIKARAQIQRVITVRSPATWRHHTRRSRGAWTTDHDQRHVRINKELWRSRFNAPKRIVTVGSRSDEPFLMRFKRISSDQSGASKENLMATTYSYRFELMRLISAVDAD